MSTIDGQTLVDELQMFGVELDSEADCLVMQRIEELCAMYKLDETEFTNEWVAFSNTNNQLPLNEDTLKQLEQNVLLKRNAQKKPKHTFKDDAISRAPKATSTGLLLSAYGGGMDDDDSLEEENINVGRFATPKAGVAGKAISRLGLDSPYSPSNFSPLRSFTPCAKYQERQNAGSIVAVTRGTNYTEFAVDGNELPKISDLLAKAALTSVYPYMRIQSKQIADELCDLIDNFAEQVSKDESNLPEIVSVCMSCMEEVTICGQVFCDGDGKLNPASVMIQGSEETSMAEVVQVDVSQLKRYSFFPGQITALIGTNPSGRSFVAQKQFIGSLAPELPVAVSQGKERLQVFIASGPFTPSDSLSFEPLYDLLRYCRVEKPDALLLTGPFLDEQHPCVANLVVDQPFSVIFDGIMQRVSEMLTGLKTQAIIVPSQRDINHQSVYPCPPFELIDSTKKYENIHFVSDPSQVVIDGVLFGVSSVDVLLQLSAEEIAIDIEGTPIDRMGRLCQHLLLQRQFYPIYPAQQSLCVERQLLGKYATMIRRPHVLVLPSDLRFFAKEVCSSVGGVLCVNAGRLTKAQNGGTFARLTVDLRHCSSATSVADRSLCEIVRV